MKLDFDSGKKIHNYVAEYADIYDQMDKSVMAKEQLGMLRDKYAVDKEQGDRRLDQQQQSLNTASALATSKNRKLAMEYSLMSDPHLYHEGGMKKVVERLYGHLGNVEEEVGMLDSIFGDDGPPRSVMSALDPKSLTTVEDAARIMWANRKNLPGGSELTDGQFQTAYIKPLREIYKEGTMASASKQWGLGGMFTPSSVAKGKDNTEITQAIADHQAWNVPLGTPPNDKAVAESRQVSQHGQAVQAIGAQLSKLNTVDEVDAFATQVSNKQREMPTPPSKEDIAKVQQLFLLRYQEVTVHP